MEQPSPSVCAFINAYIESIDFLRVLLLVARKPEQEWQVDEIAGATALTVDITRIILQRLIATGFITSAAGSVPMFKYAARAEELNQMVRELIELDDRRPVTLIRLVYARKSSSAQAFADAFRLRRD